MISFRRPHLTFTHQRWQERLRPGHLVIDATAGNGYDTLFLSCLVLRPGAGKVYAIDLQRQALESARCRVQEELSQELWDRVVWVQGSHETFPCEILPHSVHLIVYNLGYLPGGDKSLVTRTEGTLESLQNALPLLAESGAICVTCYPGHVEGKREMQALVAWCAGLSTACWQVSWHQWIQREDSPCVLWIENLGVAK